MKRHLCNGQSIEHQPSFPVLVMLGLFSKFHADITLFKEIMDVPFGTLQAASLSRRNLLDKTIHLSQ